MIDMFKTNMRHIQGKTLQWETDFQEAFSQNAFLVLKIVTVILMPHARDFNITEKLFPYTFKWKFLFGNILFYLMYYLCVQEAKLEKEVLEGDQAYKGNIIQSSLATSCNKANSAFWLQIGAILSNPWVNTMVGRYKWPIQMILISFASDKAHMSCEFLHVKPPLKWWLKSEILFLQENMFPIKQ